MNQRNAYIAHPENLILHKFISNPIIILTSSIGKKFFTIRQYLEMSVRGRNHCVHGDENLLFLKLLCDKQALERSVETVTEALCHYVTKNQGKV